MNSLREAILQAITALERVAHTTNEDRFAAADALRAELYEPVITVTYRVGDLSKTLTGTPQQLATAGWLHPPDKPEAVEQEHDVKET